MRAFIYVCILVYGRSVGRSVGRLRCILQLHLHLASADDAERLDRYSYGVEVCLEESCGDGMRLASLWK